MKDILLVDDDPHDVGMMSELLSSAGHHVIAQFDAETALLAIREGLKFDLVITDYKMPRLDGLAFMMLLREMMPTVPVIMITGQGNIDVYIKAMSLGAFDYINKPVSAVELIRNVNAALGRRRADDGKKHLFYRTKNTWTDQPCDRVKRSGHQAA